MRNFDAIIIGVGFSGLYQVHSLRDKLGLKPKVFIPYAGGLDKYRKICGAITDSGYNGFLFTKSEKY